MFSGVVTALLAAGEPLSGAFADLGLVDGTLALVRCLGREDGVGDVSFSYFCEVGSLVFWAWP